MPVINFSYSDLCGLMGREVSYSELRERLPMMGSDLNQADEGNDDLSFEFFPDRPDLFSVEGVARAFKAFLGFEPGLRRYRTSPSDVKVRVDPSVDDVRPYIWSALVEDVVIDDALIKSMMDLQEKLHLTIGRNRRKVAIGIHDFDRVTPPFTYKAVMPDEVRFFPLQGEREMTPAEILSEHDKGRAYAFVLDGKPRYPLIVDSRGVVLSMPPIINGIDTEVSEDTKTIFVDCTGTDRNAIASAVNILTTALADRGGVVRTVTIEQGGETFVAPDLTPRRMDIEVDYANRWLGTDMSEDDMVQCLGRMGHDAAAEGRVLRVEVPSFRSDIIHPVDLAEDIAIGHGYEKFGSSLPREVTFGEEDPLLAFGDRVRPIMTGLGYFEVVTLSLSNPAEQYTAMNLPEDDEALRIRNPVTEMHTLVRTSLLPSLFGILRRNKHRELPQRVFEIGDVVRGGSNRTMLAAMTVHSKASFTEYKSLVLSLGSAMGFTPGIEPTAHPAFTSGRCARVSYGEDEVGVFGEVHPSTIESFELKYPVAAFEFDLERVRQLLED